MRRFLAFLTMVLALALAGVGGALLVGVLPGHSKEFSISLAILLLAASQLLLLAVFWR